MRIRGLRTAARAVCALAVLLGSCPPGAAAAEMRLPALGVAAGPDLGSRTASARARELDDYTRLRVRWIRHDVAWDVVEPQRDRLNWAPSDAVIGDARQRGLNSIVTLGYTPPWANGGWADHRFAPRDAEEFGAFAGRVAQRYAPQDVHVYEIWNEPNIGFWQPRPDPALYVQVLRAAAVAIRRADPAATIVTGGMSPAGDSAATISPHRWLRALYAAGAKPWFDAIGHHPYVDADVGPTSRDPGNPWFQMAGSSPSIRSIQAENGDSAKRIWATEVGCRRSSPSCGPRLVSAASLWRKAPWAGVLAWFTYWDPNDYGLVDGAWRRRPEWYALQSAARWWYRY